MHSDNGKGKAPAHSSEFDSNLPPGKGKALAADTGDRNLSNIEKITTSASTLLQSLLQPTPVEASTVQAATSSKLHAASASVSSHAHHPVWAESSRVANRILHPSDDPANEQQNIDFRNPVGPAPASTEREYQYFSERASYPASTAFRGGLALDQQPLPPQEDILDLLSSSNLTEEVWRPEPSSSPTTFNSRQHHQLDPYNTHITELLAAEDIVEFLSRDGTVYTDEVWGDMLGLVQEARNEVTSTKSKAKDQSGNGTAVDRLKTILGQLKSKL